MVMKKMRKGQTMVEYILIVCLIAISLIGVLMYFGKGVGEKFVGATDAISDRYGSEAKSELDSSMTQEGLRRLGSD